MSENDFCLPAREPRKPQKTRTKRVCSECGKVGHVSAGLPHLAAPPYWSVLALLGDQPIFCTGECKDAWVRAHPEALAEWQAWYADVLAAATAPAAPILFSGNPNSVETEPVQPNFWLAAKLSDQQQSERKG